MAKSGSASRSVTAAQATAFRLARQHLASTARPARSAAQPQDGKRARSSIAAVCSDVGGIQAQVMSAAEMSIWTRRRSTTQEEIRAALWTTREIVKTSAMRLTLHLIPARDLAVYIEALRPMAMGTLQRWQSRIGAKPDQVKAMVASVVDALGDGARTQQELIACARKTAGKGMRTWLDHAWSAVRPAVIDGLIVYGPPRGAEATFVRADTWLGPQNPVGIADARAALLRRFLSAFGPATAHDFSKWSGIKTSEARVVLESLRGETMPVSVGGAPGWILEKDAAALARSELDEAELRLLGPFDSFLLAHATKEHLVEPSHYKRVYRPQGWISPVVLRGGKIVGVWFPEAAGKQTMLRVEMFGRVTRAERQAIERDADEMSRFTGQRCTPRFV